MNDKTQQIKLSEFGEGKLYKTTCSYWWNATFFRLDGRLMYRLDDDNIFKTTYEMYPGLLALRFYEYTEPPKEELVPMSDSPTFLDDYVDQKLKEAEYAGTVDAHKVVGMTEEQWHDYIMSRVDRSKA